MGTERTLHSTLCVPHIQSTTIQRVPYLLLLLKLLPTSVANESICIAVPFMYCAECDSECVCLGLRSDELWEMETCTISSGRRRVVAVAVKQTLNRDSKLGERAEDPWHHQV